MRSDYWGHLRRVGGERWLLGGVNERGAALAEAVRFYRVAI